MVYTTIHHASYSPIGAANSNFNRFRIRFLSQHFILSLCFKGLDQYINPTILTHQGGVGEGEWYLLRLISIYCGQLVLTAARNGRHRPDWYLLRPKDCGIKEFRGNRESGLDAA